MKRYLVFYLLHDGKFVMDFKEKAELFTDFLTRQCSLANSNSKLSSVLKKKTCQSLLTVEFSKYDILKMIRNLNPNKALRHDIVSIWMLKIHDEFICKALRIIFWSCLPNGKFPSEWKKSSVVPVFKNNKKQVKNYHPISLLPVSSKIFERLLYDSMFKFFSENSLISQNQSGYKPEVTLVLTSSCHLHIKRSWRLICVLQIKGKWHIRQPLQHSLISWNLET